MKIKKNLQGLLVGISMLGIGGCASNGISLNNSFYGNDKNPIKVEEMLYGVETYEKNMFRNYLEVVDDAIVVDNKKDPSQNRVSKINGGYIGVVDAMKNERDKDYYIAAGIATTNAAILGLAIVGVVNSGSSGGNTKSVQTGPKVGTPSSGVTGVFSPIR